MNWTIIATAGSFSLLLAFVCRAVKENLVSQREKGPLTLWGKLRLFLIKAYSFIPIYVPTCFSHFLTVEMLVAEVLAKKLQTETEKLWTDGQKKCRLFFQLLIINLSAMRISFRVVNCNCVCVCMRLITYKFWFCTLRNVTQQLQNLVWNSATLLYIHMWPNPTQPHHF